MDACGRGRAGVCGRADGVAEINVLGFFNSEIIS